LLHEIRFIRLDDDTCQYLNQLAQERNQRVSDLVNEILRNHLHQQQQLALGQQNG
jgi:hypothetical protein